jgi:hypothetical protein
MAKRADGKHNLAVAAHPWQRHDMFHTLFLVALAAVSWSAAPAWAREGAPADAAVVPSNPAASAPPTAVRPTIFIGDKRVPAGDSRRFGAYEDNYVLMHRMRNNRWTHSDAAAVRVHYSLRYVLKSSTQYAVFMSYMGEFDFYWGTRPSDPVINRLSNPAIRYQWNLDPEAQHPSPGEFLELAWEHASTGQVTEVLSLIHI